MSNDRVVLCNFETAVQTDPTSCLLIAQQSVVAPGNRKGLAPEVVRSFSQLRYIHVNKKLYSTTAKCRIMDCLRQGHCMLDLSTRDIAGGPKKFIIFYTSEEKTTSFIGKECSADFVSFLKCPLFRGLVVLYTCSI